MTEREGEGGGRWIGGLVRSRLSNNYQGGTDQPPLTPVAPPPQPPVDTLAPCFLVCVVGGYILELWGMDDPCRLQGFNKNDKYHQGSRVTLTQPDGYW